MDVRAYFSAVLRQDADAMRFFFQANARVRWPNTGEDFSVEEFICANCAYPGAWRGELERVEKAGNRIVTVTRVAAADGSASFHAVSFITLEGDRIAALEEYWGEDGPPPAWRRELLKEQAE